MGNLTSDNLEICNKHYAMDHDIDYGIGELRNLLIAEELPETIALNAVTNDGEFAAIATLSNGEYTTPDGIVWTATKYEVIDLFNGAPTTVWVIDIKDHYAYNDAEDALFCTGF